MDSIFRGTIPSMQATLAELRQELKQIESQGSPDQESPRIEMPMVHKMRTKWPKLFKTSSSMSHFPKDVKLSPEVVHIELPHHPS
jgi:hypothetical protein